MIGPVNKNQTWEKIYLINEGEGVPFSVWAGNILPEYHIFFEQDEARGTVRPIDGFYLHIKKVSEVEFIRTNP